MYYTEAGIFAPRNRNWHVCSRGWETKIECLQGTCGRSMRDLLRGRWARYAACVRCRKHSFDIFCCDSRANCFDTDGQNGQIRRRVIQLSSPLAIRYCDRAGQIATLIEYSNIFVVIDMGFIRIVVWLYYRNKLHGQNNLLLFLCLPVNFQPDDRSRPFEVNKIG